MSKNTHGTAAIESLQDLILHVTEEIVDAMDEDSPGGSKINRIESIQIAVSSVVQGIKTARGLQNIAAEFDDLTGQEQEALRKRFSQRLEIETGNRERDDLIEEIFFDTLEIALKNVRLIFNIKKLRALKKSAK